MDVPPPARVFRRRQLAVLAIIVCSLIIPSLTLARLADPADSGPLGSGDWAAIRSMLPGGLPVGQEAYVKASNTGEFDWFGHSVAVSGDTVVIGAVGESSGSPGVNGNQQDNSVPYSGAAYVFVRTAGGWAQQAYLKAATPHMSDGFGWSVAIDGDTVVVGAPREDGGINNDASDTGTAYVFTRSGTTWSQQAALKAAVPLSGDHFGSSVAIDGDTIVAGVYLEDSGASGVNGDPTDGYAVDSGAAYVFVRTAGAWSRQAYLKASNPDDHDQFGWNLAVDGDTVVVGALRESSAASGVNGNQQDNSLYGAGAAYVFVRDGAAWSQQAYLKASNPHQSDYFGRDVAIAGDTIVVGAPDEDGGATTVNGNQNDQSVTSAGAAYVFVRAGAAWSQQAYLKHPNTAISDWLGSSVAVSGDMVVAGGAAARTNGLESSGAAYVFVRAGGVWGHQASLAASNPGYAAAFGYDVAAGPDLIAVGSNAEKSAATGINGDQSNTSLMSAGAAYFFADPASIPPTGIPTVIPTHQPATQTALAITPPACNGTATAFPTERATTTSIPTEWATTTSIPTEWATTTSIPSHPPVTQTALAVTPSASWTATAFPTDPPTTTALVPSHPPATQTALAVTPSAPPACATVFPATVQPTGTQTVPNTRHALYLPLVRR